MPRQRCRRPCGYVLLIATLACAASVRAQELTVIGFNVESGGADPQTLSAQIGAIQGCDLWGFSEVENADWAAQFERAAEQGENADFRGILGSTGGSDRLLIVYKRDRLALQRQFELDDMTFSRSGRAPLVAQFHLKPDGPDFLFMVNHLYLTNPDWRHEQARRLNSWASAQTLPIIAVGDYNFGWEIADAGKQHDIGYDLLTANQVLGWVPPRTLVRTKCAVPAVVDFTFVGGPARDWRGTSEILFPENSYCPGDDHTSDHRPVRATFVVNGTAGSAPAPTLEMLLRRIERLEKRLGLPPEP